MAANRESHTTDPNATLGGKFQIAGKTVANIPQVEANTRALRVTRRDGNAMRFGGAYMAGGRTTQLSSYVGPGVLMAFIWPSSTGIAIINKVTVSVNNSAAAATAGVWTLKMTRASAYTAGPGTGTKTVISPVHFGTLRATNYEPQATIWLGLPGPLTGATQTLDTNPLGIIIVGGRGGAVNETIIPYTNLFEARPGDPPLILQGNQGFDINLTTPANNCNPEMSCLIYWEEYAIGAY